MSNQQNGENGPKRPDPFSAEVMGGDLVEAKPGAGVFAAGMTLGQIAKTIAWSKCFGNDCNPYVAAVKVMAGQEIGLGPVEAMRGLHVFDGKIELGAAAMSSKIKGSGFFDYEVVRLDETGCYLSCWEKSQRTGEWKQLPDVSFTADDAKNAGLLSKATWAKYFTDMAFSRAMSRFFRRYCPHLAGGAVYAEGEISDAEGPPNDGGRAPEKPAEGKAVEQASTAPGAPEPASAEPTGGQKKNLRHLAEAHELPAIPPGTLCQLCEAGKEELATTTLDEGGKEPLYVCQECGDALRPDPTQDPPAGQAESPESSPQESASSDSTETPQSSSTQNTSTASVTPSAEPSSTGGASSGGESSRDRNTEAVEHPYVRFCRECGKIKAQIEELDDSDVRYREVFKARGLFGRAGVDKGATKLQREILCDLHDALTEALGEKAEVEAAASAEVAQEGSAGPHVGMDPDAPVGQPASADDEPGELLFG